MTETRRIVHTSNDGRGHRGHVVKVIAILMAWVAFGMVGSITGVALVDLSNQVKDPA